MLSLVVTMTVIAVLGAGMLYLTATSSYGHVFANFQARAYYLGESGANYALQRFVADGTKFAALTTFTLSNGDQFAVTSYDNPSDTSRLIIESTGILNSGWTTTRRLVTLNVVKETVAEMAGAPPGYSPKSSLGFDQDENSSLDTSWNVDDGTIADIVNTGPSSGPALQFRGDSAMLNLSWYGNAQAPDLLAAWTNNDYLLSYAQQVKINIDMEGGKGQHFMMGISFRLDTIGNLDPDDDNSYGASFFRSIGRGDKHAPAWLKSSAFNTFINAGLTDPDNIRIYAVLWKKESGNYTLLDSRLMTTSYGVISAAGLLKTWSTLLVDLEEQYSGAGGARQNHIRVYVQGPDSYPLTTKKWDFSLFNPVLWSIYNTGNPTIAAWASNTSYAAGAIVRPATQNGHCYVCTTAGTSGGSAPAWPTARNGTVTDGTAVWEESNQIVDSTFTSNNYRGLDFAARKPAEIGIHAYYDSNAANDQFFAYYGIIVKDNSGGGGSGGIQY